MYGYNTGIVAGISKPATLGFFNSTFLDKETERCVQIENKPGAMSASTSPSSMAALEGLFVSDILVGMLAGAYLGPWIAKGQGKEDCYDMRVFGCNDMPHVDGNYRQLCVASPFAMHFGDWMWSCCHHMPIVCHWFWPRRRGGDTVSIVLIYDGNMISNATLF